jgi:hypothetical protein
LQTRNTGGISSTGNLFLQFSGSDYAQKYDTIEMRSLILSYFFIIICINFNVKKLYIQIYLNFLMWQLTLGIHLIGINIARAEDVRLKAEHNFTKTFCNSFAKQTIFKQCHNLCSL